MDSILRGTLAASIFVLSFSTATYAKPGGAGGQPTSASAQSAASQQSTAASPATQPSPSSASFESQMLAFDAIDKIAMAIARNVCAQVQPSAPNFATKIQPLLNPDQKNPSTPDSDQKVPLVIYDQTTFANILQYSAFKANAKAIISAYKTFYETLTKRTHAAPASPVVFENLMAQANVTDSTSNSTSLSFSPDSDITTLISAIAVSSNSETYGSVTIPDSVVAVAVTRELNKLTGCHISSVVYPPLYGQGSASDQSAEARIQRAIDAVQRARQYAHAAVPQPTTVPTSAAATTTTTYPWAALFDIDTLYDNFMNSLLQVNASTGVLGSTAIVQGHELAELIEGHPEIEAERDVPEVLPTIDAKSGLVTQIGQLGHKGHPQIDAQPAAYVLLATVVAAGGTAHDHKTFWTELGSGDDITYSGGAIVSVALWNGSTRPVYVDVLRDRVPLTHQEELLSFDRILLLPVATPMTAEVAKDSKSNSIDVRPWVTSEAAKSIAISSPPTNGGTVTVTGMEMSYTPTPGFAGTDTFTYTVVNELGPSAPATATIIVRP